MNEMIERAVKRLQEAFSSSAYGLPHLDPHTGEMLVRVVVEAMREPTEAMAEALTTLTCSPELDPSDWCEEQHDSVLAYRNAVSAALKE